MNIMCLFFFCYIALLSGFVIYQTIQHCSPYIIISHSLLVLNCIWPSCISYSAPLSSQLLPASVFSRAGESMFAVMSVRCLPPWKTATLDATLIFKFSTCRPGSPAFSGAISWLLGKRSALSAALFFFYLSLLTHAVRKPAVFCSIAEL